MKAAVVIPTYNRKRFVLEAVQSVLAQEHPARPVVVDDGSKDGTREALLETYGEEVTVVVQENAERGAARNRGVEAAGEVDLLFFLDADDLLLPGHVAAVAERARDEPDTGVFVQPLEPRDLEGNRLRSGDPTGTGGRWTLRDFLMGRVEMPPSALAVRPHRFHAVGGFETRRDLAGSEDWLFSARALAHGPASGGSRVTSIMRKHPGNSMADAASMERTMRLSRELFFREYEGRNLPDALQRAAWSRMHVNAATTHFSAGEVGAARRALREAVARSPRALLDPRVPSTWVKCLVGPRGVARIKALLGRGRGSG